MTDDNGGGVAIHASPNGVSLDEKREKFLKVDKPPFDLDPIVERAQRRLEEKYSDPDLRTKEGREAGHDDEQRRVRAELEHARQEADSREMEASAADAARAGANDALDAAQSGRDHAVEAQAAARRALDAIKEGDLEGLTAAAREAAQAAEDARGQSAKALDEAEQAELHEVLDGLQRLLTVTTEAAGVIRAAATMADAATRRANRKAANPSAAPRRGSDGGSLFRSVDRFEAAAAAADEIEAPLAETVGRLTTVAADRSTRAFAAERKADTARRRVATAEAAVAALGGGVGAEAFDMRHYESPADELMQFVARKGMRSSLVALTALLNRNSLTEVERLLLSTPGVYEWALLRLLKTQGSPATDTKGLRLAVVAEINSEPKTFLIHALLDEYIKAEELDIRGEQLERLQSRLTGEDGAQFIRLAAGRTGKALDALIADERRERDLPKFVKQFAAQGEIDPFRFTPNVQATMVSYLENLGLTGLDEQKVRAGKYDEYFVQAYNFALFGDGRARPLKLRAVRPSESDFLMDTFDLAEDQGVVREHILASAALYQIYVLGDQAGIFAMPTALMLRRARGRLDLSRGTGSQQLQEYKRYLRTAPLEPEDRQLLYRRVFNEGSGDVLEGAVANEEFPTLWDALMREIAEYIRKTEENSSDLEDKISRGPVDEAVRNLQYNLSFYATDIAEDVRDLKEQYDLALAVIQNPDIVSSIVTGPRQNMWTVIERVMADDLKKAPNVSAMRRLGVEGYKILRYVADFEGPVSEDAFKDFIKSGEIWIIAKGGLGTSRSDDDSDDGDQSEDDESRMNADDDWES
jgi:hypothetical protein